MCASPKVSEMSLWGAVPLHPRDRRTQGSVGGDCWTSRGGTCGRWRAGGPPSSQEGEPASEKIAQRHLGRFVGEPRRLRPCLTAPTAVTPASAVLLPLASRYPHIPCLLNTLGWWKRARLPCSAPGSSVGEGSSSLLGRVLSDRLEVWYLFWGGTSGKAFIPPQAPLSSVPSSMPHLCHS